MANKAISLEQMSRIWGKVKNYVAASISGLYTKPNGGIPKSDLSSEVQTSLGKADTALQSFTESDPTVPAWAKQSSKPTYTAQEVGALPSSTPIPTRTSDLTNDSGFLTQHQDISGKQDLLVSGTNIKTINGQSVLGSGNIALDEATSSNAGLMSAADKTKLDNVASTYETKTDATTKQTAINTTISELQAQVAQLSGVEDAFFGGIVGASTDIATDYSNNGYSGTYLYMVGTDMTSLVAYQYTGSGSPTQLFGGTTYDFTDYSEVKQELGQLGPKMDQFFGKDEEVVASGTVEVAGTETGNITLLYQNNLSFEEGQKIEFRVPNYTAVCDVWAWRINGGPWQVKGNKEVIEYTCTGSETAIGIYIYRASVAYLNAGTLTASIVIPAADGELDNINNAIEGLQESKADASAIAPMSANVARLEASLLASKDAVMTDTGILFIPSVSGANVMWSYKTTASSSYLRLLKGQKITFNVTGFFNFTNPANYYVIAALSAKPSGFATNSNITEYFIEGVKYSDWNVEQPTSMEYVASQDCWLMIANGNTQSASNIKILYDKAEANISAETDARKATTPMSRTYTMGYIANDGSIGGSSLIRLYTVLLKGISRVVINTITNVSGGSPAWATYDGSGNVVRIGPKAESAGHQSSTQNVKKSAFNEFTIDVEDGEESLKFIILGASTKDGDTYLNYFYDKYYTNLTVKEQVDLKEDDAAINNLLTDNENIEYLFTRMMNSAKLRHDLTDHKIFEYTTYGDPSDCTMVYDDDNFYIVGVKPGATGTGYTYNDIAQGSDCGIKVIKIPRDGSSTSESLVLVMGQSVTCTDGTTYTIQRGGSMPNVVIMANRLYIIFSTMVNDTFCQMRCIWNPSTELAESYSICKLTDAPLTYAGLLSKGYNLEYHSTSYINKTINMNAWYGNAKDNNGKYYCGMTLCGSYKYPFVLTTTDFETFEVYKQIVQPYSKAMFELTCCLSADKATLYTALRNNANYIIVNSIDVASKEIKSTRYLRGASSRPCLYLGHDNNVYLYYTLENARQSGRIANVTNWNNQVMVADIMQQVQYAEFQKADDGQTYFMFVFNRIFQVKPETYTYLQAWGKIDAIMNLT